MRGLFIAIYILVYSSAFAQATLTLDSVIALAVDHHPQLLAAEKELEEQVALKKGSFSLPDPQILLEAPTGDFFTPGIQQTFDNPLVYIQQSKVGKQQVALAEAGISVSKSEVIRQVSIAYTQLQYAETTVRQYFIRDSIFNALYIATNKRHAAGDAGLLEKTSAQAQAQETALLLTQAMAELYSAKQQLALLTGLDTSAISVTELIRFPGADDYLRTNWLEQPLAVRPPSSNPFTDYAMQNSGLANQRLKLAKAKTAPGFSLGYMNQDDKTSAIPQRFQFGLSVPLWFWTHSSRIKAAKANVEKTNYESALVMQNFNSAWLDATTAYQKHLLSLEYYENTGLHQSETILDAANRSYAAGEVGYIEYLFALSQAFGIKASYYETLKNYNTSIIELNYLNGD
ncbi:TolC family protein [Bacteroidales bacterium AH-315-I05]|nr:TolC family protein [Bacteroidales bacterium AH-315-I05]